ncbi:hypothetical protein EDC04DRAFT_2614953 [Pisolithus marmoratus]|nr:hypothetical protein EDC04DRAFT_2614953 [Pisolithus marmoratus]
MNADDDVLDGKKKVPDTMMHTFRAGDEVIVQGENGTMWYGVIEEVRVQHLKTIYKIASKIVSESHIISMVDLAPVDVMKFREGEAYGPLIASDDVFTQWSMMTIGKQALEVLEGLPTGNKGMQKMVTELSLESGLSLDRKGLGVAGNGNVMMPMWKEFWMALEEMKQDMGVAWKSHITPEILKLAGESHVHYQCLICSKEGREWYL